ncbi:MAG TPA: nuclease A inhibitor family protein, partial [Pyrinomonadaceae bacterium]|nr:nuclease A inhibitor family protein [Pyrinomonadaceae bacterium]
KAAHSVETYSLEEFFNRLTKKREWFGPAEIAMADKFARLQSLLQENLIDLKMVRTGTVRVTIVIAGRDAEGRLMGIRTEAVET